jgi:hypothetical protein
MSQQELFHADEYDALLEDAKAIGIKKLAALLKPECDPEDAAKWLNNCLDRTRAQKPDPPHYTIIINEARKVGSFAYVTYLMRETYFEPPVPKNYETEVRKVGQKLHDITGTIQALAEYVNKLDTQVKK